MTKAPIAIFIAALLVLLPGVAIAGHSAFTDGPFGAHEAGVHWMADTGITSGCTSKKYCPGAPVSRAQMATFMHRLSGTASVPPVVNAATLQGRTVDELGGEVSDWQIVTGSGSIVGAVVDLEIPCPDGTHVLGGGGGTDNLYWTVIDAPFYDGATSGWYLTFVHDQYDDEQEVNVAGFAVCADVEEPSGAQSLSTDRDPRELSRRIHEQVEAVTR